MKKIFLIGRRRTGIKTTIKALSLLGYKKSKTLTEEKCTDEQNNQCEYSINEILVAMEKYDVCGCVRDYTLNEIRAIEQKFPDSTFILNLRDSDAWYASFVRYFNSLEGIDKERCPQTKHVNKGHYVSAFYEKYNNDVQVHFDGRNWKLFILKLDGSHTWAGICSYLRKPVPSVGFPHENRSK
jgi:hypothetical protein